MSHFQFKCDECGFISKACDHDIKEMNEVKVNLDALTAEVERLRADDELLVEQIMELRDERDNCRMNFNALQVAHRERHEQLAALTAERDEARKYANKVCAENLALDGERLAALAEVERSRQTYLTTNKIIYGNCMEALARVAQLEGALEKCVKLFEMWDENKAGLGDVFAHMCVVDQILSQSPSAALAAVRLAQEAWAELLDDVGTGEGHIHWCVGEGCNSCRVWVDAHAALKALNDTFGEGEGA